MTENIGDLTIETGTGVTERNRNRIHAHVADPNFVSDQAQYVRNDLNSLTESIQAALLDRVHDILDDTDADLETMVAPDTALLTRYPKFGRRVQESLNQARKSLVEIEVAIQPARDDARGRGYIA